MVRRDGDATVYVLKGDKIVETPLPQVMSDVYTSVDGVDQGVRLRDLDGDGRSEILVGNSKTRKLFTRGSDGTWRAPIELPGAIVDAQGRDNGVRFVDIDRDGYDDFFISNDKQSAIHLYEPKTGGFTRPVKGLQNAPKIVIGGA